jgi:hypothetical protein
MLGKWIKIFLLVIGIGALILITRDIQKPFWIDQYYAETLVNFQKTQDILPYRLRTIWWNKSIILVSIIERTIGLIWAGNYFYLPMISLLILAKKRKWLNLGLIIIGLAIISIEKDPNPGKYLWWLTPLLISGFIR